MFDPTRVVMTLIQLAVILFYLFLRWKSNPVSSRMLHCHLKLIGRSHSFIESPRLDPGSHCFHMLERSDSWHIRGRYFRKVTRRCFGPERLPGNASELWRTVFRLQGRPPRQMARHRQWRTNERRAQQVPGGCTVIPRGRERGDLRFPDQML